MRSVLTCNLETLPQNGPNSHTSTNQRFLLLMTPTQALAVLDQATQPNARLTRDQYVIVEQALKTLAPLVKAAQENGEEPPVENP
jgi:hypothetical protein